MATELYNSNTHKLGFYQGRWYKEVGKQGIKKEISIHFNTASLERPIQVFRRECIYGPVFFNAREFFFRLSITIQSNDIAFPFNLIV